jgi:hypothetical protein
VSFFAEILESRQLLSVASIHAAVAAPLVNVPALVGPVVPAPVTGIGTTASTSPASPITAPQVVIVVAQSGPNAGSSIGATGGLFVVEELFSPGISSGSLNATSPTQSSAGSASSTNASTSAAASNAITPLTATILAAPTGAARAPIIVVVVPQPLVANLGPSSISVTTQAILATATQEEQPIQPPVLGQGFESPVGQGSEFMPDSKLQEQVEPARIELQLPPSDYIEPLRPAPDVPAPGAPAQPVEPQAATTARRVVEPVEDLLDEPISLTEWGKQPDLPRLAPRIEIAANEEYPTWSLATMVGTVAVASGGYHLLLNGSARFNQRWIPLEQSRRRKSTAP